MPVRVCGRHARGAESADRAPIMSAMDLRRWSSWATLGVAVGVLTCCSGEAPEQRDASAGADARLDAPVDMGNVDAARVDAKAQTDLGTADTAAHDLARDGTTLSHPNECASPGANWVFCSSFEEGNKDVWDDYDGNPDQTNTLMADPGPLGMAGNHVMRLRVPAGRGGTDLVKVLPESADRMYARWYVKWEAGYDFSALNHGSGLNAGNRSFLGRSDYRPAGDDYFGAWIEPATHNRRLMAYSYYRGMYMNCADPNGQCWGDMFPCTVDEGQTFCEKPQHREGVLPPELQADRWYCIEMMLDGGTPQPSGTNANGVLDYWVDGLEIGPWNDLWLRTSGQVKVSLLWLSLFHHEDHSTPGLMLDHVVVSKSRIGCLN